MIETWILVIAIYQSGAVTIPYPDKAQCEAAAAVVKEVERDYRSRMICVPGGGQ